MNVVSPAMMLTLFASFYGIMLCQTYQYFRTYPKDAPILKTLVRVGSSLPT